VLPVYIAYTSLVLCSLVLCSLVLCSLVRDFGVLGNLLVLLIKDLVTFYFLKMCFV
jgi:hypothetical protein